MVSSEGKRVKGIEGSGRRQGLELRRVDVGSVSDWQTVESFGPRDQRGNAQ